MSFRKFHYTYLFATQRITWKKSKVPLLHQEGHILDTTITVYKPNSFGLQFVSELFV